MMMMTRRIETPVKIEYEIVVKYRGSFVALTVSDPKLFAIYKTVSLCVLVDGKVETSLNFGGHGTSFLFKHTSCA